MKILGVHDGEMSAHRIYTSKAHLFCVVEGDLRAGMSGCLGVSFFFSICNKEVDQMRGNKANLVNSRWNHLSDTLNIWVVSMTPQIETELCIFLCAAGMEYTHMKASDSIILNNMNHCVFWLHVSEAQHSSCPFN